MDTPVRRHHCDPVRTLSSHFRALTLCSYVVALSEYDLLCEEDERSPRFKESLTLFKDIINNKFLRKTPVVVFYNKDDLFKEKVGKVRSDNLLCIQCVHASPGSIPPVPDRIHGQGDLC